MSIEVKVRVRDSILDIDGIKRRIRKNLYR